MSFAVRPGSPALPPPVGEGDGFVLHTLALEATKGAGLRRLSQEAVK